MNYQVGKRVGTAEIKDDGAEVLAASLEVDRHALTLNLLCRFCESERRESSLTFFEVRGALGSP
jgi:hypothetical protein